MSEINQRTSGSAVTADSSPPNAMRLLIAGFMAILAAGMGLSIRGALFGDWSTAYNFTGLQNGMIGGAGLSGFCFGIIIGGVVVDRIGYGKLVAAAFLFHVLSAIVMFGASSDMPSKTAFTYLWFGTFLFSIANGTLEGVANPLVATLFPKNRTHYLNILHASWPAGLVLGSLVMVAFQQASDFGLIKLGLNGWKYELGFFLVPTALYAILFLGQKFPKSEASARGLGLTEMLKDVGILGAAVIGLFAYLFVRDSMGILLSGFTDSKFFGFTDTAPGASAEWSYISMAVGGALMLAFAGRARWSIGAPLLFVLFVTHTMVGSVELGTDSWIQNIEGTILTPRQGTILFMFTSIMMFGLRFCGHFIEHRLGLKPVAILFVSAIMACIGLNLVSYVNSFGFALLALTVYALGKTFFWPTMLAVASDRFPKCGGVAISIMGGLGMMSAGLIGGPGLGYFKDRFAAEQLQRSLPTAYEANAAKNAGSWMFFPAVKPIEPQKVEAATKIDAKNRTPAEAAIVDANVEGSRQTLRVDSFIPATMAVIYFMLLIYFAAIGGYKSVHIGEEITGGLNAPMEA